MQELDSEIDAKAPISNTLSLVIVGSLFGSVIDHATPHMLLMVLMAAIALLLPGRLIGKGQRIGVLGAVAAAMLVSGARDDVSRLLDGKVRVWNVYHYYVGAKYFPELGYTDLYLATLAADREEDQYWSQDVEKIRSLENYSVRKITKDDLAYDPTAHFSPQRWAHFKADAKALARHRTPKGWRNVFRDRGYNGTPVWTAIGRFLGAIVPASSPLLFGLIGLDLALLGATATLLFRTFGGANTIFVVLLFAASPTNVARLVGGFLQTDWFCALVAGVCFLQRKRPILAGVLISYAVMTRAFPLAMVACAGAVMLAHHLRQGHNRADLIRRSRFYVATVMASGALFCIGTVANGRGVEGWIEFKSAISVHRTVHVIGDRRIGTEHAFTQDLTAPGSSVKDAKREQLVVSQRWLYRLFALALLAALVAVMMTRNELDALLLGTIAVFALLVLSRYYFAGLALFPLIAARRQLTQRLISGGQLIVFAAFYWLAERLPDQHTAYASLNSLLIIYFFVVLASLWREREPASARSSDAPV